MREGKFAFIIPVMTSTEGLCVARIIWIPTALASCASLWSDSSTLDFAIVIKSASSSMIRTIKGRDFLKSSG